MGLYTHHLFFGGVFNDDNPFLGGDVEWRYIDNIANPTIPTINPDPSSLKHQTLVARIPPGFIS